jgi:hypothetical protein
MKFRTSPLLVFALGCAFSQASAQTAFFFSTGAVNGQMAMASRPDSAGKFEIETADDFVLGQATTLTSATFTGLLPSGASLASVTGVTVEIYQVFPLDSSTVRTPDVPTRTNSPSDDALMSLSSSAASLSFTTTLLSPTFTTANSIQPGGIHPLPSPTTGGNGPVSGEEVMFNLTFSSVLTLPADHYFFVPQVQLSTGDFYWLSANRPIVAPGTPFAPDLQAWTRDDFLDPDWLRVGTDIVGGAIPPTYNAAFSLTGVTAAGPISAVPEPSTYGAFGTSALVGLILLRRRKTARS